jgi:hypothetical protein
MDGKCREVDARRVVVRAFQNSKRREARTRLARDVAAGTSDSNHTTFLLTSLQHVVAVLFRFLLDHHEIPGGIQHTTTEALRVSCVTLHVLIHHAPTQGVSHA